MAYIKGLYCLRDGLSIVAVRYVTLLDDSRGATAALHAAAEREPAFLHLRDPEIHVEVGELEVATYIMGIEIEGQIKNHPSQKLSGMLIPGYCNNCECLLPYYAQMLKYSIYKCPLCRATFTSVQNNPLDSTILADALRFPEKAASLMLTPLYSLPFGYPIPTAKPGSLINATDLIVATEHIGLERVLPFYARVHI